jgi:hypothetical protein
LSKRRTSPTAALVDSAARRESRTRHALTLEALADVDAGRLVDHAVVAAWAETLPGPKRRREDR